MPAETLGTKIPQAPRWTRGSSLPSNLWPTTSLPIRQGTVFNKFICATPAWRWHPLFRVTYAGIKLWRFPWMPAGTANEQIVAFNTCFAVPPIPCVATPSGGVTSVDQNRMPGQGDSFHPTLRAGVFTGNVAFTSQASLISGVTGQQVYAVTFCLPCARPEPIFTVPVIVSADSSGHPIGGDNAAVDPTGQFATFSSLGPGSTSGPTQIFLTAPFF